MTEFKRNCKSFREDYACEIMTAEGLKDCTDCMFYEPISKKILILKLGALGDIIRTTPILKAIKEKYGRDIHITWVVEEWKGKELLKKNPLIDRILELNEETKERLKQEKFDVLFSLDIDARSTLISNNIKANEKYGYYFHEDGKPATYNEGAKYYLSRVFSDYINKTSRKTYQEMIFEIAELEYKKQECSVFNIDEKYAEKFLKENNLTKKDKIVCINLGSGGRWPSKSWNSDNIIELVKKLKSKNVKILLRGGADEKELIQSLKKKLEAENIKFVVNDPLSTEITQPVQMITLINLCELVITGDTLGLHIALALGKKVIALFFCTPPWEIEQYKNVVKLTSPLLKDYFYTNEYNEKLTKSISADEVFKECQKLI